MTQRKVAHDAVDPYVPKVLEQLLLEKIAESFQWPDKNLFKEIAEGFSLVGFPEQTSIFPPEVNIPTMQFTNWTMSPAF